MLSFIEVILYYFIVGGAFLIFNHSALSLLRKIISSKIKIYSCLFLSSNAWNMLVKNSSYSVMKL